MCTHTHTPWHTHTHRSIDRSQLSEWIERAWVVSVEIVLKINVRNVRSHSQIQLGEHTCEKHTATHCPGYQDWRWSVVINLHRKTQGLHNQAVGAVSLLLFARCDATSDQTNGFVPVCHLYKTRLYAFIIYNMFDLTTALIFLAETMQTSTKREKRRVGGWSWRMNGARAELSVCPCELCSWIDESQRCLRLYLTGWLAGCLPAHHSLVDCTHLFKYISEQREGGRSACFVFIELAPPSFFHLNSCTVLVTPRISERFYRDKLKSK